MAKWCSTSRNFWGSWGRFPNQIGWKDLGRDSDIGAEASIQEIKHKLLRKKTTQFTFHIISRHHSNLVMVMFGPFHIISQDQYTQQPSLKNNACRPFAKLKSSKFGVYEACHKQKFGDVSKLGALGRGHPTYVGILIDCLAQKANRIKANRILWPLTLRQTHFPPWGPTLDSASIGLLLCRRRQCVSGRRLLPLSSKSATGKKNNYPWSLTLKHVKHSLIYIANHNQSYIIIYTKYRGW